jgi:hypothetical protein
VVLGGIHHASWSRKRSEGCEEVYCLTFWEFFVEKYSSHCTFFLGGVRSSYTVTKYLG